MPVNTSPGLLEMPDSVVPPVASLVSSRRRLDQQVRDAHEPPDVGGVDDDAALQLADRQLGVRPDQPGRSVEVDRVQRRLQPHLADHGVVDAAGLDLDLVVAVARRLRDEREPEDAHPRVEAQVCGGPHAPGQAVFGVDRRPEVGADGAHHQRSPSRSHRSAACAPAHSGPPRPMTRAQRG